MTGLLLDSFLTFWHSMQDGMFSVLFLIPQTHGHCRLDCKYIRSIIKRSRADNMHRRHALATLEVGNLSCIPVHKGADYPILNTPELFQTVSEAK